MATATTVQLESSQHPEFYANGIGEDSAKAASELLQENHEKHHIFFNQSGFHNHIVHHLLTIYALNATPNEIREGYANNASYQRPHVPLKKEIVDDMHNLDRFKTYLGKEKYYHDFLVFFQEEIGKSGWENVLNEYVFKGDERADDMLVRMFAGFLHPIIHLGFGIEFRQPAIIAEALAQAAVHDRWMGALLVGAEKAAKASGATPQHTQSVVELLGKIQDDKKLSSAAHFEDGNKIRDGLLKRAPDEMIKYASQYVIEQSQLKEKTAEMINAAVYYTTTAQYPPKQIKFDFFYMHCVNASIFFSSFLKSNFLSPENKVRLLEWKVRTDLAMYASRGSPNLDLSQITSYRAGKNSTWEQVFQRANRFGDDGHASKFIRAIANGQQACKPFEGKEGFPIKANMWQTLGNMVIDSVEAGEPTWVRSCGFDEAWQNVPERESSKL